MRNREVEITTTSSRLNLILIFTVSLFYSCDSSDNVESEYEELSFVVDTTLVSSQHELGDRHFYFRAPLNWEEVSNDEINEARQSMASDSSIFTNVEIEKIFRSAQGSMCIVSRILEEKSSLLSSERAMLGRLESVHKTKDISFGKFLLNDIRVDQYRIVRSESIIFKLFCKVDSTLYQLDYLIPVEHFRDEIFKVESSIGSITK